MLKIELVREGERNLAKVATRKALCQVAKIFHPRRRPHPFKEGSQLDFEIVLLHQGDTGSDSPEEEASEIPSF